MNNTIQSINHHLTQNFPGVTFNIKDNSTLTIPSKNKTGFEISIEDLGEAITLRFGSWSYNFRNTVEDHKQLTDYISLGISKSGRLKAYIKNGKEYKWTFEFRHRTTGKWIEDKTTGELNLEIWKKPEIKYYQNR